MALDALTIKNAKPKEKPYKLYDTEGLLLYIKPDGGKFWRMKYLFGGKEKLLSFGKHPHISLADAREKRNAAKKLLANNIDPSAQAKHEAEIALRKSEATFSVIADELMEKLEKQDFRESTMKKNKWLIELARSDLGEKPITDITPQDVLSVLKKKEAAGQYDAAGRLRSMISQIFRFAIATSRAEYDPTYPLKGALVKKKPKHHAAITDAAEFGGMLRAIDGYTGKKITKIALLLQILTSARPGEIRRAEWAHFNRKKMAWIVPDRLMKMDNVHDVPLSRQAVALLDELHPITGDGKYLFPSQLSSQRTMSENTLTGALRRLGYEKEEACAHGARASFSTFANGSGLWEPSWVEKALSHEEKDKSRKPYNRATYWKQRVELLQWWADRCDEMRTMIKKEDDTRWNKVAEEPNEGWL